MPNELDKITISDEEKAESLKKLCELLKDENDLKHLHNDKAYIQRYLYGNEFDANAAFEKLRLFYNLVVEYPDWFQKVAPLEQKWLIEHDIRIMTSERDKEDRPIYIVKLGNVNVSKMGIHDVVAVDDVWLEALLSDDPMITINGLCVIVDIANYSWKLTKWLTPENIKVSLKKIQTLPFKNYRFHIVNKSILLNAVLKILWPFLPDHIKEMIKFHGDDWESLHEHIDKKVLPPEYSGSQKMNYNELYNKLYDQNELILNNFSLHRKIIP